MDVRAQLSTVMRQCPLKRVHERTCVVFTEINPFYFVTFSPYELFFLPFIIILTPQQKSYD